MSTVTVGCKLPNGLHLDHGGKRVTLNGSNSSNVIGGHGITHVDGEFMEAWANAHTDFPPLVNGLIFAHAKENSAAAEAKERVDEKTGFEGIDPKNPGPGVKAADDAE